MNVAEVFAARAAADPGGAALHADGRWFTRGELQSAVAGVGDALRDERVIGAGDRVACLGANRSGTLILLLACARLGAVFVPLNTRLAAHELSAIVADAAPRLLVADAAHRSLAVETMALLAPSGNDGVRLASMDEVIDAGGGTDRVSDGVDVAPDAPLLLVYTSGTTGAPRGAVHTNAGLLANAAASTAVHRLTDTDRVLTVLPLFHVGGLCIQTLPALLAGAAVVLHARFDARGWLDAVATMRPTLALMVPATLRAVMADPDWPTTDLSSLRVLMAGSSTIPRTLIDAVHARGVPLGQIYGSTETGPVTVALGADDARRKAGFAGWPCFPDSVRLVDAAGAAAADGAVGEIVVRAPNLMRGYWRKPDGTGLRDGWFATGDLGRFDADGCLEVVGRNRDLIITGGENVYPAEIEDLLASIDGVAEVAVVGRPDERWGEVPIAFIVRRADAPATDAMTAAIGVTLAGRLARYKHPKRVAFVDRLPRNAMGKVQAHLLQEASLSGR